MITAYSYTKDIQENFKISKKQANLVSAMIDHLNQSEIIDIEGYFVVELDYVHIMSKYYHFAKTHLNRNEFMKTIFELIEKNIITPVCNEEKEMFYCFTKKSTEIFNSFLP